MDGVLPASQARSRDARDRLLRAGEAVFAKIGYDSAHVSDITAAAGCSVGSFYRRFRDKEAFFKALHHRFSELNAVNGVQFFEKSEWQARASADVIRAFVRNSLTFLKSNSGFFRALFQRTIADGGADYWPDIKKSEVIRARELAKFLRARGEGGDGIEAQCFFSLRVADGAIVHSLLHEVYSPEEEESVVDDLARMIVSFLGLEQAGGVARKAQTPRKAKNRPAAKKPMRRSRG